VRSVEAVVYVSDYNYCLNHLNHLNHLNNNCNSYNSYNKPPPIGWPGTAAAAEATG
jgi:hypothetical protein